MAEPAKMQLEDWLDDLCVRFIINLPQEDLSSVARICFQVEEAQWFYEDFVRPLDPTLPSMSLRTFCLRIFQHCPLLASFSVENHTKAFEEFLQYKTRVPVRGAILLNEAMDSTVLVKGWKKGASWSFPKGKINKDEDDLDCAIREVYEETGFDIRAAGLVPEPEDVKSIEITMREQQMRLYVFRDVPMDTSFQARTRKEISKIEWYRLSELPAFRKKGGQPQNDAAAAANANKFYMVAPFLVPLKKWVVQQKKKDAIRAANEPYHHLAPHLPQDVVTEDESWSRVEMEKSQVPATGAIDTLEGATRELHRLLRVQPPTQGLQASIPQDADQDKGGALLAFLHAQGGVGPQARKGAANNLNPHTPLDLTVSEAPQPLTPHHQHPTQRLGTYQQPPQFPIMPASGAPPWDAHQQYTGGYIAPQRRAPHEPVSFPPHQALNLPTLLHPQPLPPQVQTSILSRGVLYDNTPPPPNNMPSGISSQATLTTVDALKHRQGKATGPLQQAAKPSQLDGSNMSTTLLQLFKEKVNVTSPAPPPAVTQHVSGSTVPSLQSQVPSYHTYYSQNTFQASPAPAQQIAIPSLGMTLSGPANIKAPPTDKHRSTLLDILKNSEMEPKFTALPDNNKQPALPVASQPGGLNFPAQSGDQHSKIDIESQLRMASLSLQQQNKQVPSGPGPAGSFSFQQPMENVGPHMASPAPKPPPTQAAVPLGPLQILQSAETSNKPPMAPYGMPDQAGPTAPTGAGFPIPTVLARRPQASTEQKQKLLSLFSKPQPSTMARVGSEDKGKGRDGVVPDMSRSRVASLASGSGEPVPASQDSSRRGSQTPISPADRNFLLGYLEQATSGVNR